MGSERYPLLLLLAAIAIHGPVVPAQASVPMPRTPFGVAGDVVGKLRVSVQDRLATMRLSIPGLQDNRDAKQQLAQWFNFPNFFNQGCFRGYWRNC
jgi:hypothetical protein